MDPIDAAVELYYRTPGATYAGISREIGVGRKALSDRINGRHKLRKQSATRNLTEAQEKVLIDRMILYSKYGNLLKPCEIRDLANLISGKRVGINWVSKFTKRHKVVLKGGFYDSQERSRFQADTPECREAFYTLVKNAYDLHKYRPCDIYNMDETGFLFSHDCKTYQIAPRGFWRNGRSKSELGEHITVIAGIGVENAPIRPVILYKGSKMNDKWILDDLDGDILADVTDSGWVNTFQIKQWILKCFDPDTRDRAKNNPRLLFWDGCEPHCSVEIIEACWARNIHLIQLPAHMSQVFQPLDCHFFGELKRQYNLQHAGFEFGVPGYRLSKPMFYGWFKKAWHLTAETRVIRAGWRDTGLWPLSQEVMCPSVANEERNSTPEPQIIAVRIPNTPSNAITIRENARHCRQSQIVDIYADKAEKVIEGLLAQLVVVEKERVVLQESVKLVQEITGRKRKISTKPAGEYYHPAKATESREAAKAWATRKEAEKENREKTKAAAQAKQLKTAQEAAGTVPEPAP